MNNSFPVSDYYRPHVVDGTTIKKSGAWWSAVLLIRDPKNGKPFVSLYRWTKRGDAWKLRSRYKFARVAQLRDTLRVLEEYSERVEASNDASEQVADRLESTPESSRVSRGRDPSGNARRPAITIRLPSKRR